MRATVLLFCGLLVACAPDTTGPWQLDNGLSRVSFVSTKAVDVSEVHTFTQLSGQVDEAGNVGVDIELASVDTLIPIRDERMREMLFETDLFPRATLTAQVDPARYLALPRGGSLVAAESITLDLHGVSTSLSADLLVTKVSDDQFVVASFRPVIVNASAFNLGEGIEKLREVAGLPSIGASVPVSFVLTFKRAP